ncbi:unnamed protein product, partial [Prunus brigantina]
SLSQPRFSLSQPSLDYISQPSVLPFLSIIFPLSEPSRSLSLLSSLASLLLSLSLLCSSCPFTKHQNPLNYLLPLLSFALPTSILSIPTKPRFSLSQPSLDYISQPSVLPYLSISFLCKNPHDLSPSSLLPFLSFDLPCISFAIRCLFPICPYLCCLRSLSPQMLLLILQRRRPKAWI